jgi:hypothetical protein
MSLNVGDEVMVRINSGRYIGVVWKLLPKEFCIVKFPMKMGEVITDTKYHPKSNAFLRFRLGSCRKVYADSEY